MKTQNSSPHSTKVHSSPSLRSTANVSLSLRSLLLSTISKQIWLFRSPFLGCWRRSGHLCLSRQRRSLVKCALAPRSASTLCESTFLDKVKALEPSFRCGEVKLVKANHHWGYSLGLCLALVEIGRRSSGGRLGALIPFL